jgi:hypothetical protein
MGHSRTPTQNTAGEGFPADPIDGFADAGGHALCVTDGLAPATWLGLAGQAVRRAAALADREIDGPGGARGERERDGDDLAALAGDHQGPVAPLDSHRLDVGAGRLGDPQPVQGQQGHQRMPGSRAEAGGDEQGAELVAVQRGGVRLVLQPRPAHVYGG